jgi:cytosine/adenosine deaminase-related metal-dependent hydrolase
MKKISADYIFPGNSSPIKNGVLIIEDNGVVIDLLDPQKKEINWDDVEIHNGIICPGFVNTHCHLELSYLKNQISEQTQLHGFIKEIITKRNEFTEEQRLNAILEAELEMKNNGIVAVGDISNGNSTFEQKGKGNLFYHTFIEVFGSDPKIADEAFTQAEKLFNEYFDAQRVSITPHATYSVSDPLSLLINKHCITNKSLVSIHNQETASENELYKKGSGHLFEFLEIAKKTNFKHTGENALASFLKKYEDLNHTLLVHNTFTNKEDINWAKNYNRDIYWAFCPNANLYIENKLPNFHLFINEKCTIGTDSYASNWSLSVLDELKTISKSNPEIDLETLIKWATYNGAKFLKFNKLGSFEKGKTPGVNLIENMNLNNLTLTKKSRVKVLA